MTNRELTLREAAQRLSDKRTLMDDGFWVSQREMRYLDMALAATPPALDVERLIRACENAGISGPLRIAREYAALKGDET